MVMFAFIAPPMSLIENLMSAIVLNTRQNSKYNVNCGMFFGESNFLPKTNIKEKGKYYAIFKGQYF